MRDSVDFPQKYPILCAIALAFGPAIALGISRFSYTLFLPLMREDLHWSYFTSGNMNTGNAVGYFIGALTCNSLFKRYKLTHVFFGSIVLTILLIIASGLFTITPLFFMSRLLVGVTCTWDSRYLLWWSRFWYFALQYLCEHIS
jgi:predicted MFS family arabinose efflux permease